MSRYASALPIARTVNDLRWQVYGWRTEGLHVGLVPTMGALHEGHLSLVRLALEKADRVIVSVFVNPTQFAPHEDFSTYPRDEKRDADMLRDAGCHLLYAPWPSEMYPPGFSTTVAVSGVSAPLEGERRPHFFGGVATVVAKLLLQASPDFAVFGEKDYQQLQVIKRLARDLDLPSEILAAPTYRADDGLALSSRNAYLDAAQRRVAGKLNVIMAQLAKSFANGAPVDASESAAAAALLEAGFDSVDYITIRDAETLAPIGSASNRPARVLAAAWIGKTRLIDNMAV